MNTIRTLCVTTIALQLGCASAPVKKEEPAPLSMKQELAGAPPWAMSSCQKVLMRQVACAAGWSSKSGNIQLVTDDAQANGRKTIATNMEVRVKAMVKSYLASTKGGDDSAAKDEQRIESISKQITEQAVAGAAMEETWVSPGGMMLALMVIDAPQLKKSLDELPSAQVSPELKTNLVANSDKLLAPLTKEEEERVGPLTPSQAKLAAQRLN